MQKRTNSKIENSSMRELSATEVASVSGAGTFYSPIKSAADPAAAAVAAAGGSLVQPAWKVTITISG